LSIFEPNMEIPVRYFNTKWSLSSIFKMLNSAYGLLYSEAPDVYFYLSLADLVCR
jgi:hypothetical protein